MQVRSYAMSRACRKADILFSRDQAICWVDDWRDSQIKSSREYARRERALSVAEARLLDDNESLEASHGFDLRL